ncbi:minor tail protein [Gordonia phage Jalebi]|uniref:Minor tail protein n=1 Tax=Gordonia phage Jalebi TaxID=2910757 RepID=A0AA49BP52_9CAUD|nr:minor tail protein [Gordonia phage Jalebi]WNM69355.1 minor tail protein [Gordonia phage Sampudon]
MTQPLNKRLLTEANAAAPRRGRCHLVVGAGQSNATNAGGTLTPVATATDQRICMWTPTGGIVALPVDYHSPVAALARRMVNDLPAGDWILIVNTAVGSTSFTESTQTVDGASVTCSWDTTNTTAAVSMSDRAVTWIDGAEAAATALGATVIPAVLLFSGFEGDTPSLDQATFTTKMLALLAKLRAAIPNGSNCPIVLGSMVPEYIAANGQTYTQDIAKAVAALPNNASLSLASFFYGPTGHAKAGEIIHYSISGQLRRGDLAYDALKRARQNRTSVIPTCPRVTRIVREPGRAIMYWEPDPTRVTSRTVEFSTDGGVTWSAGAVDQTSLQSATFPVWPWQTVKGRIKVANSGSAGATETDYEYSETLPAVEALPSTTPVEVVGASSASIPGTPQYGTLYACYTLPASGGGVAASARNAANTLKISLGVTQTSTDLAQLINSAGTATASFANPKAVAGVHVVGIAVNATATAVNAYRDSDAPVSGSVATGTIDIASLATTNSGGAVMHGALFFPSVEHSAAQVARHRQIIASRYNKPAT